jgi:hypothetical protein
MLRTLGLFVLAGLMAAGAQAQSISGSMIKADYDNPSFSTDFSVSATSPWTNTVALGLKSQGSYTGVGVQGMTDGEIDWRNGASESITLTFATPVPLASFTLGVLFNGPEYNDVREVARITINGDATSYYLKTQATENVASWYYGTTWLADVSYLPGAGTQLGAGGDIMVTNPFGNLVVQSIKFEAAEGVSGNLCGANGASLCTNQSDYSVVSVSAVPEPQTYALLLAGLGAVFFVTRRRRRD